MQTSDSQLGLLAKGKETDFLAFAERGMVIYCELLWIPSLIFTIFGEKYWIRRQNPVVLNNNSEPEPDLAIVKYRKDYYAKAHPAPEDILLLIEVADTSLAKDRHIKSVLFAESNIPEYWIINTEEDLLEQYLYPENGRYKQQRIYTKEEVLESPLLPSLEISSLWL